MFEEPTVAQLIVDDRDLGVQEDRVVLAGSRTPAASSWPYSARVA